MSGPGRQPSAAAGVYAAQASRAQAGNAAWSRHLDLTSQRQGLEDELSDALAELPGSERAQALLERLADLVDASEEAAHDCVCEMQTALAKP